MIHLKICFKSRAVHIFTMTKIKLKKKSLGLWQEEF